MPDYETFEHDVLVIGAGGAGLRAAIEASMAGARVGLVCKSLLGKAHTVMAEGGVAAALANVDERDSWEVHFADTMRGGQYVNDWRMAELHAKEAPDRVRELEAWGGLFDRTPDGRILQRNFGGHRYPRLAHVGDRTGLEMIRTLQDHGIHQGIDVHMECTVVSLLKDGERVSGALAYDREKGLLHLFRAGAIVLATGGIGKAYRITSNSWEYTGDGHVLAYDAGAELMDMEFVQFHPTGMIWPPSVQGILVTEGVRGEGGVLLNSKGKRFLFDDIPENYRSQTADSEDEGFRYTQGDKSARRPPELLTRDHVARCIVREIREGRGSPHGGVFLDISWIKRRLPNAEEVIKKKLPSMYHQFMKLADIDITREPMEVGPTTHYMMGGVRVDSETQMSTVPGLFAAGECAAGLHGANRLGGNSLSDLLVFGQRAGANAARFAEENPAVQIEEAQVEAAERRARQPIRGGTGTRAGAQGEPWRALSRGLPRQGRRVRPRQHRHRPRELRRDARQARADPRDARRPEADRRGDEMKASFRIWRGDSQGGDFRDYATEVSEGMVVLDAVHRIQADQANDLAVRWNCKAGKCGSCSAEVNGLPRLMCMTRLSDLPLEQPVVIEPMKSFPKIRDLVTDVSWNFEVKKKIKKFRPRAPDAPDGTWRMP